jgi:uncharacterized membrane protein YphA (DoxX/SURF4 family)
MFVSAKTKRIVGWVLSGLIALMLVGPSAGGKFADYPGKDEQFKKMGWDVGLMKRVAVVEIAIAILFLVPRAAFIAAILMSAYLGGATAAHVRINDQFFIPMVIGVLAWVALGLRDPRVFRIALEPPKNEPAG